jgi:N-acyl-D-amino-acid deacylase
MSALVVCLWMLFFAQQPAGAASASSPGGPAVHSNSYDIVIVNGRIIDGTGSPWYFGQVGIRAGRIAAIGNLQTAPGAKTIDA